MESPISPIVKRIAGEVAGKPKRSFSSPMEVCLGDWWLSRSDDGQGIAVSGHPIETRRIIETRRRVNEREIFYSAPAKKRYASRVYNSAQIVKRHGCTTLETSDGFILSLCGFINRSRTKENGFSSEICRNFIYGFPFNWEAALQCASEESSHSKNEEFSECFLPAALDAYNGAQLHDLVLSLNDNEIDIFNKKMSDNLIGMLNPEILDAINLQPSNSSSSALVDVDMLTPNSGPTKAGNKCQRDTLHDDYTEQDVRTASASSCKTSTKVDNDGALYDVQVVEEDGSSISLNRPRENSPDSIEVDNQGILYNVEVDLQPVLQPCQKSAKDVSIPRKCICTSGTKPLNSGIEENVITLDASIKESSPEKPAAVVLTSRNRVCKSGTNLKDSRTENNVNVLPTTLLEVGSSDAGKDFHEANLSRVQEKLNAEGKKKFDQSEVRGLLERLRGTSGRLCKELKNLLY